MPRYVFIAFCDCDHLFLGCFSGDRDAAPHFPVDLNGYFDCIVPEILFIGFRPRRKSE